MSRNYPAVDVNAHDEPNLRNAPLCIRLVPALTGEARVLDSHGGVTASLKRAVELQAAAEGRSGQVVIDTVRTG